MMNTQLHARREALDLILPKDELDERSVILELGAGAERVLPRLGSYTVFSQCHLK